MPARAAETRMTARRLPAGRIEFDRVLVDARRSQALAFGDTAYALGARIHAISGKMDDPCYEELRRRWRVAPTPVAGITDCRALLLLQMMACDAGMRPRLRIHHRGHAASMVHEAFGSPAYRTAAAAHLSRAGMHWSGAAARLILDLSANDFGEPGDAIDPGARRDVAEVSPANLRVLDSRVLVSWAIA